MVLGTCCPLTTVLPPGTAGQDQRQLPQACSLKREVTSCQKVENMRLLKRQLLSAQAFLSFTSPAWALGFSPATGCIAMCFCDCHWLDVAVALHTPPTGLLLTFLGQHLYGFTYGSLRATRAHFPLPRASPQPLTDESQHTNTPAPSSMGMPALRHAFSSGFPRASQCNEAPAAHCGDVLQ